MEVLSLKSRSLGGAVRPGEGLPYAEGFHPDPAHQSRNSQGIHGLAGPALSPGGEEGSNVCVDVGAPHSHTLGERFLSPRISEWAGHLLLDSEGHLASMLAVGRCTGEGGESLTLLREMEK